FPYQGGDFRNAYLGTGTPCTSLTGAGQSVGLFELDSYNPPDIATYNTNAGLPPTNLFPVELIVASGGTWDSPRSDNTTRLEVAGDIDVVHAMAPAAT